jgi:hypothetical protein
MHRPNTDANVPVRLASVRGGSLVTTRRGGGTADLHEKVPSVERRFGD